MPTRYDPPMRKNPRHRFINRLAVVGVLTGAVAAAGEDQPAKPPNTDAAIPLRFVFSGDTNFAYAPFGVANHIADEAADVFIWFGDTIYSDVTAGGLGPAQTYEQYIAKYQQVLGDPNIARVLETTPVWVSWDDHEVFNDYAGRDPRVPADQKLAAYQAFFSSLPIERQGIAGDEYRTYRSYRWGANAEFFLLDGRQYRDPSAADACGPNLDPYGFVLGALTRSPTCEAAMGSADRSMLGREQLAWLEEGLLQSSAKTKFICNNVPLSYLGAYPYDRWDGYDGERRELLEFVDQHAIAGVVFLTTDIHANAYNPDVGAYFRAYRDDYTLPGNVAIAEAIVGPLGNETFHQTFTETVPALAGIGASLEDTFKRRATKLNGLAMIDTDRVSYLVVAVDEAGNVTLTWKGLRPRDANDSAIGVELFAEQSLSADPITLSPPACGPTWATCVTMLLGFSSVRSRYGRRSRSP